LQRQVNSNNNNNTSSSSSSSSSTPQQRSSIITISSSNIISSSTTTTMTTTKTTTTSSSVSSFRAVIILSAILTCSAFTPAPVHRQPHLGSTTANTGRSTRQAQQQHRNPIVRSSSYTLGDSITRTSTSSSRKSPASSSRSSASGWVRKKVSQASGVRRGFPPCSPSQAHQQKKGDWSTLFAAPESAMAQGSPLV
ncbi:unnamed protein product, partial [Laminaria digitata]